MKKAIYTLIICCFSLFTFAASSEFSYDKDALATEFNQMDKASSLIETTNATYDEISKNPVFEGNLELTKHIAVQPNFSFDEMDWISFAWGFLCCPIGFFVVITNSDKSSEEKTSFWIGVITNVVLNAITTGLYYGVILATY